MAKCAQPKPVDLGFFNEDAPKHVLTSKFFPSKVGGRPAWLALADPPPLEKLLCGRCSQPMTFLLQVYAPDEDSPRCFHRTLFVFLCLDPACSKDNPGCTHMAVFRNQMAQVNPYYPADPPDEDSVDVQDPGPQMSDAHPLCWVCGIPSGTKRCGACKVATYCSQKHQKLDWRAGHKPECGKETKPGPRKHDRPVLLPEAEIVIEGECEYRELKNGEEDDDTSDDEDGDDGEGAKGVREVDVDAAVASRLAGVKAAGKNESFSAAELAKMAKKDEDPGFTKFKKRIKLVEDQILRYHLGGEPLWVSEKGQLAAADVPPCSQCGSKRVFEFQIMPQLLNYLHLDVLNGDSVDWGTIAVYTCPDSCHMKEYTEEFLWKQDFSPD